MEKKHYDAINGLRTIACIGILMMHVRANTAYEISGFIYGRLITSFTNFAFSLWLFLPLECAADISGK